MNETVRIIMKTCKWLSVSLFIIIYIFKEGVLFKMHDFVVEGNFTENGKIIMYEKLLLF